jgi:hypothetical protein
MLAVAGAQVRRLFPSLARGWPGVGLLMMRIVAASALAGQSLTALHNQTSRESLLVVCLRFGTGGASLLGLWTPIAGALALILEVRLALSRPGAGIPLARRGASRL